MKTMLLREWDKSELDDCNIYLFFNYRSPMILFREISSGNLSLSLHLSLHAHSDIAKHAVHIIISRTYPKQWITILLL